MGAQKYLYCLLLTIQGKQHLMVWWWTHEWKLSPFCYVLVVSTVFHITHTHHYLSLPLHRIVLFTFRRNFKLLYLTPTHWGISAWLYVTEVKIIPWWIPREKKRKPSSPLNMLQWISSLFYFILKWSSLDLHIIQDFLWNFLLFSLWFFFVYVFSKPCIFLYVC